MRWLNNWLTKKRSNPLQSGQRPRTFRPWLEALEVREVLATISLVGPSGAITAAAPTFSWTALAGADHYELVVNDQTRQVAVLDNQAVFGTSWTSATILTTGDDFQWMVRGLDSTNSNASAWSSTLDFTVSAYGMPALVGPSGSTTAAAPVFTWSPVAGADHYDIWVDDQTAMTSAVLRNQDVVGTSWSPASSLKAGDTYRWWVRALDSTSTNAGPWSNSLDFAVASLGQPIPIGPTGLTSGDTPSFSWNTAVGADHYDVWVSDLTTGTSAVLRNEDVLGTSWAFATPLQPGDSYRWWVRGLDSTSTNAGPWSNPQQFTVASLAAPTGLAQTSSNLSAEPAFTWNAVAGANHYDVWVDDTTAGTSPVLRDQDVNATTWAPTAPLPAGDSFTLWVRAVDTTGTNVSPWSTSLDFTVGALGTPILIGPTGSSLSAQPVFTWNAVATADHYDIWVDNLSTGTHAVLRNQDVVGPSWTFSTSLTEGDSYRWWVRALDSTGTNASPWSGFLDFKVTAFTAPTLNAPSGAIYSAEPTLTWTAVAGADHYDVWVDDQTTGQSPVLRNQDVTGTSWTPTTPLNLGDSYVWWVRALNSTDSDAGPWSSSLDFTVTPLAAPTLSGPSGSTTSAEPAFSWTAVTGAGHYDIWVDDTTTGKQAVVRNQDVQGTTWAPSTPLQAGDSYRWWVRAIDSTSTNNGPWSGSLSFTVSAAAVGDVQLTQATGVNMTSTNGASFSGTVATFVDPAGSVNSANFTATIAWGGAGTGSSTGTIVADGNGNFHVTGSFTYANEASYAVSVTLTHDQLPAVNATPGQLATYDTTSANGNVLQRVFAADNSSTATFKNSSGVLLNDYTYNTQGQLTTYNTYYANGNVFHRVFAADNSSTATLKDSSGTLLASYLYDTLGRNLTISYPNGDVYLRTYAADGSSTATLKDSGGVLIHTYTYNAQGQLTGTV